MNALTWRPFLLYIATNSASMMGHWILRISLGWLAWQLTESSFWTSLIVLSTWAPSGILGPFIAVYAENWSARFACFSCSLATCLNVFCIWAIEISLGHNLFSLLLFTSIQGVITAFYHPIRLVLVSLITPREYMPSAVGINSVAFNSCRIVGPAIAGISIAAIGIEDTLLLSTLLYVPILVTLTKLPLLPRPPKSAKDISFKQRFKAGFFEAIHNKKIQFAMVIVGINSFFVRGIVEIQPAIVGQIFDGDSHILAIAAASAGCGALFGALVISIFQSTLKSDLENTFRLIIGVMILGLIVSITIASVETVWALSFVFALIGCSVNLVGVGTQAIIQLSVSDNYRARVMTWWSTLSFGGLSLGGLLIGTIGELMKIQYAVGIVGCIGLLIACYWCLKRKLQ